MRSVHYSFRLLLASLLLLHLPALANISLPALIADGMVLQQNSRVAIWGWADPGETVSVTNDWDHKTVKTKAGADGRWQVSMATTSAGGPYQLMIKGKNEIHIDQVMLGEVWLCSGQSNMEFPLGKGQGWRSGEINWEQEVAAATDPRIRMFTVKQMVAGTPLNNVSGTWQTCSPQTAGSFSAVAYYFGREIARATGFTVGLIHSSWGGTPAESWVRQDILGSDKYFSDILQRYRSDSIEFPQATAQYQEELARWKASSDSITSKGGKPAAAPKAPIDPEKNSKSPTKLYNGMIHPLIPYTLKGVIWYQGESNSSRAIQYRKLFPALIKSWRAEWKSEFPFYFVQIAPHHQQLPEIREAQFMTLRSVPNTGMAVITDAGDSLDIHPRNKEIVGRRLSLWALNKVYGKKDSIFSGPLYRRIRKENGSIRVYFDHTEKGLTAKDGALREFMIAGADKRFVPAIAKIEGNTIVVWSDEVKEPEAVRFAWKNVMRPNLYNGAGLPASPFRTDE